MRFLNLLCISSILITGCSFFQAPKYLDVPEESMLGGNVCYNFKDESVNVYYKRLRRTGEKYRGDLAFAFNPNDFIVKEKVDECLTYETISILEAYNQTYSDTGRVRIIIELEVMVNGSRYVAQGQSPFFNGLVDFSSNSTQDARRVAIKEALQEILRADSDFRQND